MFKNLSQLKKGLKVGMKFELTNNIKNYTNIREVVKIQSNGFWCIGGIGDNANGQKIWVDYPKASKCEFLEDRFIFDGLLIYKYI